MNDYEAIFFDWDGVITDSVNIKTEAFAQMFRKYGKDIEDKVINYHVKNGGVSRFEKINFFYREFIGKKISEEETAILAKQFSELVFDKVSNAPFVPGVIETIKEQYKNGIKLFIVSGTPTEEIVEIAIKKGISSYFLEILGSPIKKTEWVNTLISKHSLNPQKCIFIGDALSDYEAATDNNVQFLGIKTASCLTDFPKGTKTKPTVEL